ncbi:MAG: starch-binding protein, partial [Ruminococcus sp.]|nr:starch-binding protein [Ruminococcus sp.]
TRGGYMFKFETVGEAPTEDPDTPTEEPQPTEEIETITVKFTDAMNYGDVNVYYWPNGGAWPGKAATEIETNEFGQKVYEAVVPADVEGIIFNGNGRQTVDITEGIADGAWWYTVEETDESGHNYVNLVGEEPTEAEPTEIVTPTEAEPTTVPEVSDYYLVGTMNDWGISDDYVLFRNTSADTEEYYLKIDLTTDTQFKVVGLDGNKPVWYPSGMGNNYGENGEITANGTYTVYFRPKADGGEDWFYNVIYVALDTPAPTEAEQPTEAEPTEPAPEGDYYVVGNMTGWNIDAANKLEKNDEADVEEYTITLSLTTEDQFKVVYSVDGVEKDIWFPDGMGNNYGENGEITADGTYDIYFRPNGDGIAEWFYNVIFVVLHEEQPTDPEQPTNPTEPTVRYLVGDADNNGKVTSTDVTILQRYLIRMNVNVDTDIMIRNCDFNKDGKITSPEVTFIQRKLVHMEVPYPIGEWVEE